MKTRSLMIVATALAISSAAIAWPGDPPPPPPPPPPPELNDCSPGFYKNHVSYWSGAGLFCSNAACEAFVLGELTSKGPGSGDRRSAMASALNGWADGYYGAKICT